MKAVVHDRYRYRPSKTETGIDVFRMVLLFCWAGLLASLILVSSGFDLGLDFF